MKKLTENLIQQRLRTCTTDIDKVLQINITGRGLQDVSLLRKMTGVEILSLSFNNITTLSDFQYCKNLKELYLRHNNVSDLNEIYYLKKLPNLKLFMLAENPCCQDPLYRATIIRNLKGLIELDGTPISLEERKEASKIGKELGSSMEKLDTHAFENYIPDGPQILRTPTSSTQKIKSKKKCPMNQLEEEPVVETELTVQDSYENVIGRKISSKEVLIDRPQKSLPQRGIHSYKNKITPRTQPDVIKSPFNEYPRLDHQEPTKRNSKINLELYKRVVPTNSNLLSATLKLLKELDYPSLQIVNAEVTSRIDTLETEYLYKDTQTVSL